MLLDKGAKAIEIIDYDEAVAEFSSCHKKIRKIEATFNAMFDTIDRFMKNDYISSKLYKIEIKNIDELIESLEKLIIYEKKSAAVDICDWDKAERTMNQARSNIKIIKQFVSELKELKSNIDISDLI